MQHDFSALVVFYISGDWTAEVRNQKWIFVSLDFLHTLPTLFPLTCDYEIVKKENKTYIFTAAPLGSIPKLPAISCLEINASEGNNTISGKYWLDPTKKAILINCDMASGGRSYNFLYVLTYSHHKIIWILLLLLSLLFVWLVSFFRVDTLLTSFYISHCLHSNF